MAAGRCWTSGPVWNDDRVDGDRLLLLRDPTDLEGRPVVLRVTATKLTTLARVEHASLGGTENHIPPALARKLGVRERAEACWRLARWYDLLWLGDRAALVSIVLTAVAGAAAAGLALSATAEKVGWGVALAGLIVGVAALLAKARSEWKRLPP
jgi:hypothetical protein